MIGSKVSMCLTSSETLPQNDCTIFHSHQQSMRESSVPPPHCLYLFNFNHSSGWWNRLTKAAKPSTRARLNMSCNNKRAGGGGGGSLETSGLQELQVQEPKCALGPPQWEWQCGMRRGRETWTGKQFASQRRIAEKKCIP
jgi:hypothetical protein